MHQIVVGLILIRPHTKVAGSIPGWGVYRWQLMDDFSLSRKSIKMASGED